MSARCTHQIQVNTRDGSTKFSFKSHAVYALDAAGHLVRVRHRRQLPIAHSGSVAVWVVPKGTLLDAVTTKRAAELLSLGAGHRLDSLVAGSVSGTCPQARQSGPTPPGFAVTSSASSLLGEGGAGFRRPIYDELAVLLTTDRASETFYESRADRRVRARALTVQVTALDPDWVVEFATRLRQEHKVRTAAVAFAVDSVAAGHPHARRLLAGVLVRPDEPGLALRYFYDTYPTRSLPAGLRKAVADAAVRLYNERSVISYDSERTRSLDGSISQARPVRFADVLSLTHPVPRDARQSALFGYLTGSSEPSLELLPVLAARQYVNRLSRTDRTELLDAGASAVESMLADQEGGRLSLTGPLGSLSWRELLAWAPKTPAQIDASAAVTAATATLNEFRDEFADEFAQAYRSTRRLQKLEDYQIYEPSPTRQTTIDSLRARLAELAWLADADAEHAATAAACRSGAAALKGASTKAWTVAVTKMGYKDTLSNLANLAECSPTVAEYAANRIRNLDLLATSSVQVTDMMTAATVLTFEPTPANSFQPKAPRALVPAAQQLLAGLDDAATSLARTQLGDFGTRRILVMVDASTSMYAPVSAQRGDNRASAYQGLRRDELAAAFAGMVHSAGQNVDVVSYNTNYSTVDLASHPGALDAALAITAQSTGGSTDTWRVLMDAWADHDVVLVLTDEQTSWSPFSPGIDGYGSRYGSRRGTPTRERLPESVKVITCNLAGDVGAHAPSHANHLAIFGASSAVLDGVRSAVLNEGWASGVPETKVTPRPTGLLTQPVAENLLSLDSLLSADEHYSVVAAGKDLDLQTT